MTSTTRAIFQTILTSDASLSLRERELLQRLIDGKLDVESGETRRADDPLLVTQQVAARLLSVNRVTIYRMAKTGVLRMVEIRPGTVRYDYRELLALTEKGVKSHPALRVVGQENE